MNLITVYAKEPSHYPEFKEHIINLEYLVRYEKLDNAFTILTLIDGTKLTLDSRGSEVFYKALENKT